MGVGRKSLQTTQGSESSPVVVAGIILQQQLLGKADLLQLLAQFVQLAGQLLALQLLQHQVLQGQRTSVGGEPRSNSWPGSHRSLSRLSNVSHVKTRLSRGLRQVVQRGRENSRDVFQRAEKMLLQALAP